MTRAPLEDNCSSSPAHICRAHLPHVACLSHIRAATSVLGQCPPLPVLTEFWSHRHPKAEHWKVHQVPHGPRSGHQRGGELLAVNALYPNAQQFP
eukprot:6188337-Pleurochrysis_carterae.AAC.4